MKKREIYHGPSKKCLMRAYREAEKPLFKKPFLLRFLVENENHNNFAAPIEKEVNFKKHSTSEDWSWARGLSLIIVKTQSSLIETCRINDRETESVAVFRIIMKKPKTEIYFCVTYFPITHKGSLFVSDLQGNPL